jgi:hypothetical protein
VDCILRILKTEQGFKYRSTMKEVPFELLNNILLCTEFIAALVALFYLFKLKKSYWKWFSIYLIVIFLQEYFWIGNKSKYLISRLEYYTFFGFPLEYFFFYWLYAYKSLKKKMLFWTCCLIFVMIFVMLRISITLEETNLLMTHIGTSILIILLIMEFIKQIKNDDILKFRENKMFYINLGLVLFYIGSFPFQIFARELHNHHRSIYDIYYSYFLVSNSIMYLLFAASFIWGKTR